MMEQAHTATPPVAPWPGAFPLVFAPTAATDPQIAAVFTRPFAEQVAFFRGKLRTILPTATWRDLLRAQHDHAFVVAGVATADLLADLAAAVDTAIAAGETLQQFRARFAEIVTRHGWTGAAGTNVATAWRARVIYETNLLTSYAAGRVAQLEDGKYPYWVYKHSRISRDPRPQHLAWDGLVLPSDHEFWDTHTPPNGWGCRCRVLGARSRAQARRLGGDPDKRLPGGWNARDPQGRVAGVDEGWEYKPGDTVSDAVRLAAQKIGQWESRLARQFVEALPARLRDALATATRTRPRAPGGDSAA